MGARTKTLDEVRDSPAFVSKPVPCNLVRLAVPELKEPLNLQIRYNAVVHAQAESFGISYDFPNTLVEERLATAWPGTDLISYSLFQVQGQMSHHEITHSLKRDNWYAAGTRVLVYFIRKFPELVSVPIVGVGSRYHLDHCFCYPSLVPEDSKWSLKLQDLGSNQDLSKLYILAWK